MAATLKDPSWGKKTTFGGNFTSDGKPTSFIKPLKYRDLTIQNNSSK
jgi:hypothetical protein